jgi:hypothetical protein
MTIARHRQLNGTPHLKTATGISIPWPFIIGPDLIEKDELASRRRTPYDSPTSTRNQPKWIGASQDVADARHV